MYRSRDCYHRPYPMNMPHQAFVQKKINQNTSGTVLRVHIPAGAVISLLNLAEICSPEGISLLVRIPFLSGTSGFSSFVNTITGAGGSAYPMNDCDCRDDYFDYDPRCR